MNINDGLAGIFRSLANTLSSESVANTDIGSTAALGTTEAAVTASEASVLASEVKQHVKSESVGYTLADSVVRAGESVSESEVSESDPITASRDPVGESVQVPEMANDMVSKSVVNKPSDYSVAPAIPTEPPPTK